MKLLRDKNTREWVSIEENHMMLVNGNPSITIKVSDVPRFFTDEWTMKDIRRELPNAPLDDVELVGAEIYAKPSKNHQELLRNAWMACSFALNSGKSDRQVNQEFDKWYHNNYGVYPRHLMLTNIKQDYSAYYYNGHLQSESMHKGISPEMSKYWFAQQFSLKMDDIVTHTLIPADNKSVTTKVAYPTLVTELKGTYL